MRDGLDFVLVGLAAVAAGFVNALAGGGSLVTFPTLLAVGVPPVVANVTNTVALCPGYVAAIMGQIKDLRGQSRRIRLFLPAGALGGILGGFLLLKTSEKTFVVLVPFLILLASGLLAAQEPLRARIVARAARSGLRATPEWLAVLPVVLASVYGGYFGAGLSVIVLASLGLFCNDSITRLNVLKQSISFAVNVAAALIFVFSGHVIWTVAVVMAAGAIAGGFLGGRLAGRIKPNRLRWLVVVVGVAVGTLYLLRL